MQPYNRFVSSCLLLTATVVAQLPGALDWQLDANPPSRRSFAFVHHAAIGATVLFGGEEGMLFADTWLWRDGWQRLATSNAPSPRFGHAMAYDARRARTVLFGGVNRTVALQDTWAFDGAQWTQLAPAASPPARGFGSMVFDEARDRLVLFGGNLSTNGPWSTELWEFDGSAWALRPQSGPVPTAFGNSFVYDAARGETLDFTNGSLFAWDGTQWSSRSSSGLPANTTDGPLVYEPVGQRVLLVNPLTNGVRSAGVYAWQGQGWSLLASAQLPTTAHLTLAVDGQRQQLLGVQASSSSLSEVASPTWRFDGANWLRVLPGVPLGRSDAAMAYDAGRQRLVVHGGRHGQSTLYDTEELDGRAWVVGSLGVSGAGLQLVHHGMVFDERRGVTVLFGGAQQLQNWLVEWDGSAWTHRQPSGAPPGRWSPAMAFDRLRSRTLVFGGQGVAPNLGDTWAWSGTAWTDLTPVSSPSPRQAAGLCYDVDRDRAVLFGGTDGTSFFDDTWEFDGVLWAQVAPALAPPARASHVQAFDSVRRRTIVYGGGAGLELHDTWSWDGASWSELLTTHRPDAGTGACGAFDRGRQELVVFGGLGDRGEVWRLRDTGIGSWTSRGTGCNAGNGDLALASAEPVVIGAVDLLTMTNLPSHFAVLASLWIGFDDQQWNGTGLPVSLAAFGSPACFVRLDPVVPGWLSNLGTGTATGALAIPNATSFVDVAIFAQGVCWDVLTNRVTTSNLLAGRIGVP